MKGCYTSCPSQEYRVYPQRRRYSGPPTRSHYTAAAGAVVRCCCCCGLGARTHTKPVPDLWVDGIHRRQGTRSRMRRPGHLYPPTATERTISVQSQNRHNYCSYTLQRGFTATPARCWAALYHVGCLIVRAAKAVSLCLAHATSRHVFSCLGKRRAHSGRHRQSLTVAPTKSLQNSCFIDRAWPNFPSF